MMAQLSLKNATAALLAIALLLLALIPLRWALGDFAAYPARQSLEHWQTQGTVPDDAAIQAALTAADNALYWQANNGEYLDLKALLLYYRAISALQTEASALTPALAQTQADDYTRQALDTYRQSTQARPHWPYSWANLALMKARLNEFDAEYHTALEQAIAFGPWENAVNISIAEAGMLGWFSLSKAQQQAIIANIQRGIPRNSPQIKQSLSAINKLALVCGHLAASPDRKRLCGF